MNKLAHWLSKQEYPQSAKSFAAFRIAFCLFILVFIAHISYYRPLIFNTIPNLVYNPFPAKLFLSLWALVAACLLAGWQSRINSVINYIFIIIATFLFSNTGSGSFNDDLLRIGGFLMIVMPVGAAFSLDTLIANIRFGAQPEKRTTSLHYLAALLVSLGLMYFASGITKLGSPMWIKGLGLWIPATMPYNKWHSFDLFLDMEGLMKAINYFTMAWELLFIFFLFHKKWRLYFAVLGIFFHLIIALLFPFPLLCFGAITFYFLFIPDPSWKIFASRQLILFINPQSQYQQVLGRFIKSVNRNAVINDHYHELVSVNGQTFRSNRKAAIAALNHTYGGMLYSWLLELEVARLIIMAFLDDGLNITEQYPAPVFKTGFKRFWLIVFTVILLSVQLFYSGYHLVSKARGAGPKVAEARDTFKIRKDITDLSLKPSNLFRTLFGLNARGVFLDHSNTGTKTVFAIIHVNSLGDTTWLPFFDRNGYTLAMNMNLAWSKYTFNSVCSGTIPNPHELEKTLWLWAEKNHIKKQNINLQVLKRTYIYPKAFEAGYQQKMAALPWLHIANTGWLNGKFTYNIAGTGNQQ